MTRLRSLGLKYLGKMRSNCADLAWLTVVQQSLTASR
jgi:hypothetical protein